MRSNVECWRKLHEGGYFANHPNYGPNPPQTGEHDVEVIERFTWLRSYGTVVVVGSGYGRESSALCKRVAKVYGIDVIPPSIRMENFIRVMPEFYEYHIPDDIDLVYSVLTFQHLTRDLVNDYLNKLGAKLSATGSMLLQFLETPHGEHDAKLEVYEPSVSWTMTEIEEVIGNARLKIIKSVDQTGEGWTYHWVHLNQA